MTSHDNWQGSSNATDELYMQRCIELARHGMAAAPPNPMVGAVIVHQGRIIGEGWHRRCGGPHAEVNAIASVAPTDAHLLPEATIYVSLEPCSHWGRTPPCADLIVEKGLRRVVVGCQDPFAKVSGRGIERLRQAGIDVTVGVLQEECLRLNRRFITFHTRQRPWITLKWAQSADAYIDRRRTSRADGSGGVFLTESARWLDFLAERGISWANWSLCDKDETSAALRPGTSPGVDGKGTDRVGEIRLFPLSVKRCRPVSV